MSNQELSFSRFVVLCIVLMPLGANAGTGQLAGQIACPTLLTEMECHDYQTAWRKAQSEADKELLEDKYAVLLNERSRLCPHTTSLNMANEAKERLQTKQPRYFAGRKIGM